MRKSICMICFCFAFIFSFAQINFTAHDQIIPYTSGFGFGTNMGYNPPYTDEQLADIAAGTTTLPGVGVNTLRPALFEWFVEQWGYDIRLDAFAHYQSLGIRDNVAFIGYPSPQHRDNMQFCAGQQSELFANMYADIWDGGANGTPVNDDNYFALYCYKIANLYGPYVKFWEIWNEPDFDHSGNAWKPVGEPGNWWESTPQPCDIVLKAPVQHYVRMLRIAYEVIKFVDPSAYIAVGGLGYPSFLDVLLRNTDNPADGSATPDFPLPAGAYFDVLSYHSYPHIDGSLRSWNNDKGDFDYFRHSDAAANGVIQKKEEFEAVLKKYKYDDRTFPEKEWIITESNIPRKAFGEYMGSNEAQRNFVIKTLVACLENNIRQFHIYNLAETAPFQEAANEFELMGLYQKITNTPVYNVNANDIGIAYRTASQLLKDVVYDASKTAQLDLPANVKGGAFKRADGTYCYILWAQTSTDRSEDAGAVYSFPRSMNIDKVNKMNWDHSFQQNQQLINSEQIMLNGTPSFFEPANGTVSSNSLEDGHAQISCSPNPFSDHFNIELQLSEKEELHIELFDIHGRKVIEQKKNYVPGKPIMMRPVQALSGGLYCLRIRDGRGRQWQQQLAYSR